METYHLGVRYITQDDRSTSLEVDVLEHLYNKWDSSPLRPSDFQGRTETHGRDNIPEIVGHVVEAGIVSGAKSEAFSLVVDMLVKDDFVVGTTGEAWAFEDTEGTDVVLETDEAGVTYRFVDKAATPTEVGLIKDLHNQSRNSKRHTLSLSLLR